jgi:hypothetical protein
MFQKISRIITYSGKLILGSRKIPIYGYLTDDKANVVITSDNKKNDEIEEKTELIMKVPVCNRCGKKTYMIRRSTILRIDPNKNPWFCVKCTQKDLLVLNTLKKYSDEIAHLEGKIPNFVSNGDILQLNPKTRQYRVIDKVDD